MPLHLGQTVVHSARGEFFIQPVHDAADVVHAGVEPKGFADIRPALFIEGERDGVGEHRFGRPETDFQAGRDLEFPDGQFGFIRGRGYERRFGAVRPVQLVLRPCRDRNQHRRR